MNCPSRIKIILILISILLFSCSETSDQKENTPQNVEFPEQTDFTKSVIDSLGNVNEYKKDGYILYCRNGSYSDQNREFLFDQVAEAVDRIKEVLEIERLPRGFYLVMLDSRDEMERIIGNKYKGIALRNDDLALFVYSPEIRPYFKHELFHLISYRVWGDSKSRVLEEGGAMYSDNKCLRYKNPVTVINKFLYENDKWFGFEELINNFGDKAAENDMIAYLESAYIFKHLYENYETEQLIKLWKNGFAELKNIYGFDINGLRKEIDTEMEKTEYKEVDWEELMEKGCG